MTEPLAIFKRLKVERWSRTRRRKLVAVMYLALAAFTIAGASISPLQDAVGESAAVLAGLSMMLSMPVYLVVFVTLRHSVQMLADEKEEKLDERQRGVRYRAHYRAYRILTWLLGMVLGYGIVAYHFPEFLWLPDRDSIWYVSFAVIWLLITLPTAVAAWTEPDSEHEGEA